MKPVAGESTLDAAFSPEGMFVVSGNLEFYLIRMMHAHTHTLPSCEITCSVFVMVW